MAVLFYSCQPQRWALLSTYPHPHAPGFLSIVFVDSNNGWGLTTSALLRTDDGGKTWSQQLSDETKTFYALQFVSLSTGFIVGTQRLSNGNTPVILRTLDAGKSWHESSFTVSSSEPRQPLGFQSIDFVDERVGWAAGFGLIAHTIDGGELWEIQRDTHNSEIIFAVDALTQQVVVAVGNNGLVLRTLDGGRNWIPEKPVTSERLLRIRTFGEVSWIVGGNGTVLRSVDRGETWRQIHLNTTADLRDIYMKDTEAWIVGTRGLILHRDKTDNWFPENTPTDRDLNTLFFLRREGWIGGAQQTLLRLRE